VDALAQDGVSVRVNDARDGADVHKLHGVPASVVLEFEGGSGCVIPSIPGFVSALSFDQDELIDVAFEPAIGSHRFKAFEHRSSEIRALRAVAASSSRNGLFRLLKEDSLDLELIMQYGKSVDPTLALYAAYAYHDLHDIERIRAVSTQLRHDIGNTFFDLALLGRQLMARSVGPDDGIVPFVPLLSQGWALLGAHRVTLHPALRGAEANLKESLWTLFDREGVEKLKRTMKSGEVR
jgi:hypothetical protein